ncbi:MAG: hypothetical protein LBC68_11740 [Prevotellaceae bacterium]|jgi:hypothetical protein|nr:hypothetical protein [Prevotellaceae bacterium]
MLLLLFLSDIFCFVYAGPPAKSKVVNGKTYKLNVHAGLIPAEPAVVTYSINASNLDKATHKSRVTFAIDLMKEKGK